MDVGRTIFDVWVPRVLIVPIFAIIEIFTPRLRPLFLGFVERLAIEFVVVDRRDKKALRRLSPA